MINYDQMFIAFRAYVVSISEPPYELGQIDELATKYKEFAHDSLDKPIFEKIVGELKEQLTVVQDFGNEITDDTHEPWWERFKSSGEDELFYWSRFNKLLMQDPGLPSSVTNRLDL